MEVILSVSWHGAVRPRGIDFFRHLGALEGLECIPIRCDDGEQMGARTNYIQGKRLSRLRRRLKSTPKNRLPLGNHLSAIESLHGKRHLVVNVSRIHVVTKLVVSIRSILVGNE